jgi:hypothetical protein
MALNDVPEKHRSRPRTLHTDKNCVIVECSIKGDQRVKVYEIIEVTGIADCSVHDITDLNFHEVSVRWVLNTLTEK